MREHGAVAARLALATRAVELEAARLSGSVSPSRLRQLERAAGRARRDAVQAGEWSAAVGGGENLEQEDLPRAEAQVTSGADELAGAMVALRAYARALVPAAIERYRSRLARGREQWDEGITEVWHLAHASNPPIV